MKIISLLFDIIDNFFKRSEFFRKWFKFSLLTSMKISIMYQVKKTIKRFFEEITVTPQSERFFDQASYQHSKDAIKGLYLRASDLVIELILNLNIKSVCFLIRQFPDGKFYPVFSFGIQKCQISDNHPLVGYLLEHRTLVFTKDFPELIQQAQSPKQINDLEEIKFELMKHQATIVGGIYSDQELIGVLLIGAKVNGLFDSQDLSCISQALNSSSKELAQIMHYRKTQAMVFRRIEGQIFELS